MGGSNSFVKHCYCRGKNGSHYSYLSRDSLIEHDPFEPAVELSTKNLLQNGLPCTDCKNNLLNKISSWASRKSLNKKIIK
jgi:hypothetical protein